MKTTFGIAVIMAGAALVLPSLLAESKPDSLDQKFTIIQTCEPSVNPGIGEALPALGRVRLVINVDATGKLVDWMLIDYACARYADAAVNALKKWQYRPAIYNGEPIGVRTEIVFNFETRGQVVSLTGIDTLAALTKSITGDRQIQHVCKGDELDVAPRPLVVVSPLPIQPVDLKNAPQGVRVDFYIDETGRPRMATVDMEGNALMAAASLEAIEQWRFTPPTRKGHPVAVRASQWFDFGHAMAAAK